MRKLISFVAGASASWGYLTKQDILLILAILIQALTLLYDYIKNRDE